MESVDFLKFGRFLRRLRTVRGLSLRNVEAASHTIPPGEGEMISYGYLRLLESGRPTKVAFGKLMSLAGIYNASIHEFIDATPARLQPGLRQEFHRWHADRPVLLDRARFVDHTRHQRDKRLEALVFARARSVDLPAEDPDAARANLAGIVRISAIPPFLASAGRRVPPRFWRARRDQLRELLPTPSDSPNVWNRVSSAFSDWLAGEDELTGKMVDVVAWWTADYRASLMSCHFADRAHEQVYACDLAPISLLSNLRWAQTIVVLAQSAPRSLSLPAPPAPADALHAYLSWLLRPRESDPESWHGAGPAVSATVSLAAHLAREVPAILQGGPELSEQVRAAVIRLMTLALAAPTASPTRRPRPAHPPRCAR